jgi:hypothetical protein
MYHHVTIFMIWWAVIFYAPGGDSKHSKQSSSSTPSRYHQKISLKILTLFPLGYFSAAQNAGVHVLMYSYYALRAIGVNLDKYKRYVTYLQMFQFMLNIVQAVFHITADCKYPKFLAYLLFVYMITLLALFYNFLRNSRKRSSKPDAKKFIHYTRYMLLMN